MPRKASSSPTTAPKAGRAATKTPTKTTPKQATAALREGEPDEITPTALTSEDREFLERASTFLFQIQGFAARARAQGYDDAEHAEGLRLYDRASGRDRPLSHWIAESVEAGEPVRFTADQTRLLQEIDQFENAWFPRIRGILQRAIPEERLEKFQAAFFKDLSQQPLGPTVLDSVSTLISRFEQLEKSGEPGAKDAFALGVKRGLTKEKIVQTRELIQTARTRLPSKSAAPVISAKALSRAREEQLAALKELRRWYNDWASTFRTVFGVRAQVRLGLTTLKRGGDEGGISDPPVAPAPPPPPEK